MTDIELTMVLEKLKEIIAEAKVSQLTVFIDRVINFVNMFAFTITKQIDMNGHNVSDIELAISKDEVENHIKENMEDPLNKAMIIIDDDLFIRFLDSYKDTGFLGNKDYESDEDSYLEYMDKFIQLLKKTCLISMKTRGSLSSNTAVCYGINCCRAIILYNIAYSDKKSAQKDIIQSYYSISNEDALKAIETQLSELGK